MIRTLPVTHVNAATGEPMPQFESDRHPGTPFWNKSTIQYLDAMNAEVEKMRAERLGRKGE